MVSDPFSLLIEFIPNRLFAKRGFFFIVNFLEWGEGRTEIDGERERVEDKNKERKN